MSHLAVCAVWDAAVQAYMRPMFVSHTGGAVRAFADEVNKKDANPLAAHPEDYELHHLAVWDEFSGVFTPANDNGVDIVLIRGKDALTT